MNQNIKKYEEQSYQITDYRIKNIGKAVKLLISEYNRLAKKAPLHNSHEGWAVLNEELDDPGTKLKRKIRIAPGTPSVKKWSRLEPWLCVLLLNYV